MGLSELLGLLVGFSLPILGPSLVPVLLGVVPLRAGVGGEPGAQLLETPPPTVGACQGAALPVLDAPLGLPEEAERGGREALPVDVLPERRSPSARRPARAPGRGRAGWPRSAPGGRLSRAPLSQCSTPRSGSRKRPSGVAEKRSRWTSF